MAIISWMAGILYLFRLFVYHSQETEPVVRSRFKIMEFRLYRYITAPAMVVAFVMGVTLLFLNPSLLSQGWMHGKLFLVGILIVITHYAGMLVKQFGKDEITRTHKFYRIMNEIPTLLMIGIVILVIMRPF
jgi:protoporphyrinogen IX oxidase